MPKKPPIQPKWASASSGAIETAGTPSIAHQLDLLALVRRLPVTGVIALHDLNLAGMFCDELAVLSGGRVVAAGTPAEVLTEELVAQVYGARCSVSVEDGSPPVRFVVQ